MNKDDTPSYVWVQLRSTDEQWALIDENSASDVGLRSITKLGPYLGKPEPFWRLYLDEGYEDYSSRDEAMEAGVASLG